MPLRLQSKTGDKEGGSAARHHARHTRPIAIPIDTIYTRTFLARNLSDMVA